MANCGRKNSYDCFRCIHEYSCDQSEGKDCYDGTRLHFKSKDDARQEQEQATYANALYDHLGRGRW